jgi:hypothetical protein
MKYTNSVVSEDVRTLAKIQHFQPFVIHSDALQDVTALKDTFVTQMDNVFSLKIALLVRTCSFIFNVRFKFKFNFCLVECGVNEEFQACGIGGCQNTCEVPDLASRCRPFGCTPGCYCTKGYLKNSEGLCVPAEECKKGVNCYLNRNERV